MTIDINNCAFELLYEKAMYKPDEGLLIIADVHLGKASHFRKEGIQLPAQAQMGDYDNLTALFEKVRPRRVCFLGDLFHSTINGDWHHFCDLVALHPAIKFTLVRGNHDLISTDRFDEICVEVVAEVRESRFIYTHEPLLAVPAGKVNIAGHIHPGFVLSGMGRQSIKLPCFYATSTLMLLPAFGVLTGLYIMDRRAAANVYLVLPDRVKAI